MLIVVHIVIPIYTSMKTKCVLVFQITITNILTYGGVDACQGDAGGSVICDVDGSAVLTGVISWGIGCAGEGYPGISGRVYSAIGWINTTIAGVATTSTTTTTTTTTQDFSPIVPAITSLNTCTVRDSSQRIIGGQEAVAQSWPWIVSIGRSNAGSPIDACSGTVLDDNWILTAADPS